MTDNLHQPAANKNDSYYQPRYAALTKAAGCGNASSTLDCLRALPLFVLNNILNTTEFNSGWNPTIDGDFIARYTSLQLAEGDFVHVPIISGANSDEGASFGPMGINSTADFEALINSKPPPPPQTTTPQQRPFC